MARLKFLSSMIFATSVAGVLVATILINPEVRYLIAEESQEMFDFFCLPQVLAALFIIGTLSFASLEEESLMGQTIIILRKVYGVLDTILMIGSLFLYIMTLRTQSMDLTKLTSILLVTTALHITLWNYFIVEVQLESLNRPGPY